MEKPIRWTKRSIGDIKRISAYLMLNRPSATTKLALSVARKLELLTAFSEMGRFGKDVNTRELVLSEYPFTIHYRIKENYVEITRITHHAQYH